MDSTQQFADNIESVTEDDWDNYSFSPSSCNATTEENLSDQEGSSPHYDAGANMRGREDSNGPRYVARDSDAPVIENDSELECDSEMECDSKMECDSEMENENEKANQKLYDMNQMSV